MAIIRQLVHVHKMSEWARYIFFTNYKVLVLFPTTACNCDSQNSISQNCTNGTCTCIPGATGATCNGCTSGYYKSLAGLCISMSIVLPEGKYTVWYLLPPPHMHGGQ